MKNYILLTTTIALLAISCGKKQETKKEETDETLTVEVQPVSKKSLSEPIIASGVLSSKSEMKLAFKTGGMIRRVYVQEGQFVKEGQLLAELDLSEIDAQVRQAKLGLEKSERDLERVKKLYADEAATLTNVQDATTGYDVAKQSVQVAEFNQKLSRIYAPTSGRILRKISEQGELITPFAPAFILGTGESAYLVNVGLADRDVVKVKLGDAATVYLDAYPNEPFHARVTQIAQTVNPATGTFEVELQLTPNGKKLISGFVAKAEISSAKGAATLSVPIEALVEADKDKAFVFTLNPNQTVNKTPVRIGHIFGSNVAITSGITEGTQIITKGANFLTDKAKVKINHNE
ncbi:MULTISPECIES: efflux RND transporter periplasmic adaptor subunit [Emticicia]|uniref:efflux RND transporter periplasmic adaptor subunit n=1 Tax=Emticicia TaxID=312278 RepID=UPI0007D8B8C8|nr:MULTISPECIES: efflux RND transporter periplasmic adaptor subunit [Emticicia]